jgi:flavodoxin
MKSIIVYCSKTGNTEKIAVSIQRGLKGTADMVKLDLTPEGVLKEFSPAFTLDLSEYDLVFLGGWTMVMRVHPYLSAYIQRCDNIGGRNVVGFISGGAIFSRGHVSEDFRELVEGRGAKVFDFIFITTLLGPLLTKKKLRKAEAFAGDILKRLT